METNFSLRNANIIKNDSTEAKVVTKADNKNFCDSVIDGTNTNQDELLKDVEGAMKTKDNVFIRTDKGIIKIDKDKVPEVLAGLKEKLSRKDEYKVTGIGLDTSSNEFKVNFTATPHGERTETIQVARDKANQTLQVGNKEYKQEIKEALQITDPAKRSEAIQKSAEKFKAVIQKVNEGLIGEIKAANDKYLDTVKTNDPKHYPEIKKAAEQQINARINALGDDNHDTIQAVQIHADFTETAAKIQNPQERQAAFDSAQTDYKNNLSVSAKKYNQEIDKSDGKFNVVLENVKTEVTKAPEHRTEAIQGARDKANLALEAGNKEYKQEIKDALQITNPAKRSEAIQKSADKFKAVIQKENEGLIGEIKAANDKYLDIVKTSDPKHYPEIKKAADEQINARINALGDDNHDTIKAVQIRCDFFTTAAKIQNPQSRQAAFDSAQSDYKNNISASSKKYNQAVEKADEKFNLVIENVKTEVTKAPEHRTEAIQIARDKANQALEAGNKEYKQEIKDALQITDPAKRSEAIQKSADKFKAVIQKENEGLIGEIRAANDKYLDIVKTNDPKHYPEIKKAADEQINARISALGDDNHDTVKAVQIRCESFTTAAKIQNPQDRQAAFDSAQTDYKNNISASSKKYNQAVEKADSKYASVLKTVLSGK